MQALAVWTGGLVGAREPAQPLLTLYDGSARVELSGATTANWVSKSAYLLVDGYGGPERVGLLLPLHWQTVALLLAGVVTGATVVVADEPAELAGCPLAFVTAAAASAALDAGVEDVLALSMHPLGLPPSDLGPLVVDYAREVPSYADTWSGPAPTGIAVEMAGRPVPVPLPDHGLGPGDRVLTVLPPSGTVGLVTGLLAPLHAGAALVLVPDPATVDLVRIADSEQVTATVGVHLPGLRRLDG